MLQVRAVQPFRAPRRSIVSRPGSPAEQPATAVLVLAATMALRSVQVSRLAKSAVVSTLIVAALALAAHSTTPPRRAADRVKGDRAEMAMNVPLRRGLLQGRRGRVADRSREGAMNGAAACAAAPRSR